VRGTTVALPFPVAAGRLLSPAATGVQLPAPGRARSRDPDEMTHRYGAGIAVVDRCAWRVCSGCGRSGQQIGNDPADRSANGSPRPSPVPLAGPTVWPCVAPAVETGWRRACRKRPVSFPETGRPYPPPQGKGRAVGSADIFDWIQALRATTCGFGRREGRFTSGCLVARANDQRSAERCSASVAGPAGPPCKRRMRPAGAHGWGICDGGSCTSPALFRRDTLPRDLPSGPGNWCPQPHGTRRARRCPHRAAVRGWAGSRGGIRSEPGWRRSGARRAF
jgi:hypothetical protein